MTRLPRIVRKSGFELSLLLRNGRVPIYRQHRPGSNPEHDAYEVILPQTRNTNHKGEPVEPYEAFPSAESWGKKGWTFTSLFKAVQKLLQLTRKAASAGTASRKNRFDGQRRLRRGLLANRPQLVPVNKRSAPSVRQSRRTPTQRKLRLSSARSGSPRLRAVTQRVHSQTATIGPTRCYRE
jgi:hypothetical protein